MTAAENDNAEYAFSYNDLSQLTGVAFSIGSESYEIDYTYDLVGNKTSIEYPYGGTYTRVYDDLNRLDQVKEGAAVLAEYSYNNLNQRTRRDYLNSTWTSYSYNDAGWLTDLTNWRTETDIISEFSYTHDDVGNRTTMTTEDGTHTYSYDKIYELTAVNYPAGSSFSDQTFHYDSAWNRTTTINGGTEEYLSNNLNQYTEVDGVTFDYDDNGNLTDDGTQTYYYDCENQLTKVVRNSDGEMLGEYTYDPFGKRIQKTTDDVTINYVYDQTSYQVIAEYEDEGGSFELAREYIYGIGIDEPLIMVQNEERYYYYRDGLGSVVGLIDYEGNTVKMYDYAVYGDFSSSGTLSGNPYNFTGRRYDPDSGLFYYRARYYSPKVGRFLQTDPLPHHMLCLYQYVKNNPINYLDWSGLQGGKADVCCDADEMVRQMLQDMLAPRLNLATITASLHEGCAHEAARQVQEPVTKDGSPLRHCVTLCLIVGECGASLAEAEEIGKEYERGTVYKYLDKCKNKETILQRIECQYDLLKDTQADLVANRVGAQLGSEGASNLEECLDACSPYFPNEPQRYPVTEEFMEMLSAYNK